MIVVTATDLPRVMQCVGSRLMPTIMPPNAISDAINEGNAADWLAWQVFNGVPIDTLAGTKAGNGLVITSDMIEYVSEYLSALDCGEMQCETSWSGNDHPFEIHGRADHIHFYEPYGVLTIDDLKYGWRPVEPEMNWTLISHAIGYCERHNITPTQIHFRIHQPRPHHPDGKLRVWTIDATQLMQLKWQIAARLTDPPEQLSTGPACFKCHAYLGCPAAANMQSNAIDVAYDAIFSDQLTGEALANELDILRQASSVIDTRLSAYEELATHRLRGGEIVPNYATDPQYANTRWLPGLTGPFLTLTTGIDCNKPGMITPAEFKRRGGKEADYNALTERPMIGAKLRRIDANKRAQRLLKGNSK